MDAHHHPLPRTHSDRLRRINRNDISHRIILQSLSDFGDAIPWATNFDELLALDVGCRGRCYHELGIFHVFGGTSGQIGLMLLALRMGQIGAFVRV